MLANLIDPFCRENFYGSSYTNQGTVHSVPSQNTTPISQEKKIIKMGPQNWSN